MKILHVSAEFFPLLKTGGLADVLGALPKAQAAVDKNNEVRLLLPGFPAILKGVTNRQVISEMHTFAGNMTLTKGSFENNQIYVIEADHLYHREGSPYHNAHLEAYSDNYLRFALLGWVASELACGNMDPLWRAEVVHAHDWHAGLACAYLHAKGKPAVSVFTVHNIAFQGVFPAHHFREIGLPESFFSTHGVEFYGHISYLKAGLFYADHVTTVSPTYAQEITNPDFAFGLHGLLQERARNGRLTGILNGVDDSIWNPQRDSAIASNYWVERVQGKTICKAKLQKSMGLTESPKKLVFGVISRLTEQKGLDWILSILGDIVEKGGQLVLLGTGEPWMENAFLEAQSRYPGEVAVRISYSDELSHQIIAGVDVIVVPSRFEPCGLTQLYGLKYGTLPLVRHTGGLADTVVDCTLENLTDETATGFVFHGFDAHALQSAFRRAFLLWSHPRYWECVQNTAMLQDFSWKNAANKYIALYRNLF